MNNNASNRSNVIYKQTNKQKLTRTFRTLRGQHLTALARSQLLHILLLLVIRVLRLALLRKLRLELRAIASRHTRYDGVDLRQRESRTAAAGRRNKTLAENRDDKPRDLRATPRS